MYADVIETNGDLRVSIQQDEFHETPDWDGQSHVFYVQDRWNETAEVQHHDYQRKAEADNLGFAITDAVRRWGRDYDQIERYLRMFFDVVSFDYITPNYHDGAFLAVTTRGLAEAWGLDLDTAHGTKCAAESAESCLQSWTQAIEGDVWFYTVEEKIEWTGSNGATMETWEHVDSLSGMYGREYAEEEARGALEGEFEDRHRTG